MKPGSLAPSPSSWRQRANTNSSRFNHNQIPEKSFVVCGNDRSYEVGFRHVRQTIEFQEEDAGDPSSLTNDHFAEVAILGDHDPTLIDGD